MVNSTQHTDEENFLNGQATVLAEAFNAAKYEDVVKLALDLLQQYPHWGFGWKLLGYGHAVLGRYDKALQPLLNAVTAFPDEADIYNALGTIYRANGELGTAIALYIKATTLQPRFPQAYNNLGGALMMKGNVDTAVTAFLRAIEQHPDYPEAHQNLGNAFLAKGMREESIIAYGRAVNLRPDCLESLSLSCHLRLQCVQWAHLQADIDSLREQTVKVGGTGTAPFAFMTLPGSTKEEQQICARKFAENQYGNFLSMPPLVRQQSGESSKLRIGYLSADLHEHATSYLLAGVLEKHDRGQVEIYAYSYGPNDGSPMRRRIEAACDVFRDIQSLGHEASARQIAEDRIHILVDLKGFTENARPEITAMRPAPIIVNWLGYPGTLGHERLADYLIGDPVVTPPDHANAYSETLALMPHCYQPNDRMRLIGIPPTKSEAGLPENAFVFCSFNSMYKITPEVFGVWCTLLSKVQGSVLWLLQPSDRAAEALRREAGIRGVDPARLIFAPKLPLAQHLGRLQLADVALDTYPVTSHTTGSDALWAGVPLVTHIGDTFASRVAASLLHAVYLSELVAADWNEYTEQALYLAGNLNELAALKKKMVDRREQCPLFDTQRFTQDLERLYREMWKQFRDGRRETIMK